MWARSEGWDAPTLTKLANRNMNLRERLEFLKKHKKPLDPRQAEKTSPKMPPRHTEPSNIIPSPQPRTSEMDKWTSPLTGLWTRELAYSVSDFASRTLTSWGLALEDLLSASSLAVDTETTGLSGGAGTIIFLAGSAYYDGKDIRVTQFYLEDYPYEPEFLEALISDWKKKKSLVSYNGLSFDLPLLRTRSVMNGLEIPEFNNFDLVHTARRLWRHFYGSAKLSTLEQEIFGYKRIGDVPGSEIPERYFTALRSGQGHRDPGLQGVFSHHCLDMVHLLLLEGLFVCLQRQAAQGLVPPWISLGLSQADSANTGKLLINARAYARLMWQETGDPSSFLPWFSDFLENQASRPLTQAEDQKEQRLALQFLALATRRAGDKPRRILAEKLLWTRHQRPESGRFLKKLGLIDTE